MWIFNISNLSYFLHILDGVCQEFSREEIEIGALSERKDKNRIKVGWASESQKVLISPRQRPSLD